MNRNAAEDAFAERGNHLVVVLDFGANEAAERAAVFLVDDDIVGHVDKTAGKITGVGCLEGRIGKTFTCTVGGDEVFEHREAFLEVGENRVFDDLAAFGA